MSSTTKFNFIYASIALVLWGFVALSPKMVLAQDTYKPGQWEDLLDEGKLEQNWTRVSSSKFPTKGWHLKDGILTLEPGRKGRDIMTRKSYENFELEFEFKLSDSANTGIKYLVTELRDQKGKLSWNGPEYQLIDDDKHASVAGGKSPETSTASLYLLYVPEGKTFLGAGAWNKGRIIVRANMVEHWLNGVRVLHYDRSSADFRERVASTKFKQYENYGETKSGRVLLQDHNDGAQFRNVRIRTLEREVVQRGKMTYTPAEDLTLVGKIKPTPKLFQRVDTLKYADLPANVKKRVVHSAGLAISFVTNSTQITAKWCTMGTTTSATMTRVAYRGMDLYIKKNGKWVYAGVARPRSGEECAATTIARYMDDSEKECLLYLPLYNEATSVSIGVENDAYIRAGEQPFKKRVLIYGSSIVQGAAASRPGMAYPARLSRSTGLNFLNLGMGASAKMEKPVVDMIGEMEADAYILDCVPNSTPEEITERTEYLVRTIREKHPDAPIIIMQSLFRESGSFNLRTRAKVQQQNENILKEFEKLKQSGVEKLYFIPSDEFMGDDHEGSVDGTHPTDLGFDRMLRVIEPRIMKILEENGVTG
ncbi:SGNH/GDSL hydrolase family protein [Albibacterium profundi]|uniref:SGNH/GDSL hydrolase family protein n=1 Tax=Albibacterium profundi TaxID=3134906 RepID=A0ABV5CAP1_9SPHI